tara:strand:+ start:224 stop:811 length:588 start_codon:yes stop_codon:yes gene_type:complete
MRRSASEILRNLDMRIAHLEKNSSRDSLYYRLDRLENNFEDKVIELLEKSVLSVGKDGKKYVVVGKTEVDEFNGKYKYIISDFYIPLDTRSILKEFRVLTSRLGVSVTDKEIIEYLTEDVEGNWTEHWYFDDDEPEARHFDLEAIRDNARNNTRDDIYYDVYEDFEIRSDDLELKGNQLVQHFQAQWQIELGPRY